MECVGRLRCWAQPVAPVSMTLTAYDVGKSIQQPTVTAQQPVTEGYCKLLHVSIWRFESHIVGKAVSDDRRLH